MPTYEYQCPDGHAFERFQKMTDPPAAECPVCGLPATRRISGGAGLVFKGTGFYITDYGKDGKGPRKPPSEGGDKAEKPASESRPAAESTTPKSDKPAAPPPAPKSKKKGAE